MADEDGGAGGSDRDRRKDPWGRAEAHSAAADATFRKFTGIYLGIVAMLLAITALGGSNATKTMLSANIQASDTYGYYQAKNIRQTVYQLTAEQLDSELLALPEMPEAARTKIEDRIKRYRERVDRYESDPSTGDGKKELLAKAKEFEARRDHAAERDPNFDFAEALFQIAIVLGLGQHRRRLAPARPFERHSRDRRYAVDDQRLFSARAFAARVTSSPRWRRAARSRSDS